MTARANQTTGLTNGRAANLAPEVVFSARFPVVNGRSRPVAKSAYLFKPVAFYDVLVAVAVIVIWL